MSPGFACLDNGLPESGGPSPRQACRSAGEPRGRPTGSAVMQQGTEAHLLEDPLA